MKFKGGNQERLLLLIYSLAAACLLLMNISAFFLLENDESLFLLGSKCLDPSGCLIYRDLLDNKLPGLYFVFFFIEKIVSRSILSLALVRITLLVVSNALLFLIALRIYGIRAAFATGLLHLFLAFSPAFMLYIIRPELIASIIVLATAYVSLFLQKNRLAIIAAFFFFGLLMMIKAVYLLIAIPFVYLLIKERKAFLVQNLAPIVAAFLAVPLLSLLVFTVPGTLAGYFEFLTRFCPPRTSIYFTSLITAIAEFAMTAPFLLLSFFFIPLKSDGRETRFLWAMLLFSFISAITPLSGTNIYVVLFAVAMPLAALFSVLMAERLLDWNKTAEKSRGTGQAFGTKLALSICAILLLSTMANQAFFATSAGYNPLSVAETNTYELSDACRFLDENAPQNSTIQAFPTDAEIYYFCNRKPAGRLILYYVSGIPEVDKNLKEEAERTLAMKNDLKYVFVYSKRETANSNFNITLILLSSNWTKTESLRAFDVYERKK